MNKTKHITFRCTEEQYQKFKAAAETVDVNISAFILRSAMFTSKQIPYNKEKFKRLFQHFLHF